MVSILGKRFRKFFITGYDEKHLSYTCGYCNAINKSIFRENKVVILRCKECKQVCYLLPVKVGGTFIGYDDAGQGKYRRVMKKYKEQSEQLEFIDWYSNMGE